MAKNIAVLTSGGDSPGMNAGVRAVVRKALSLGMNVYGVQRGYSGLVENQMVSMDSASVSDILLRGGTILRTARCPAMLTEEGRALAVKHLHDRNIDGLVVLGGDGSFQGAKILTERGISAIGVPCTIDNDLSYTDWTIGFDTALNTVLGALKNLRDTMASHDRVCVVETMGNNCGDLALYAGLAGGAEAILVPEVAYNIDDVANTLLLGHRRGKRSGIVVIAEGAGNSTDVMNRLKEKTGLDIRATVLGHVQRGGTPSARDVVLATRCGTVAVDLIAQGIGGRVVGVQGGEIKHWDIIEALSIPRRFSQDLYDLANVLSI